MILPIISHLYSVEDRAYMLDKLARLEQGTFTVKKTFEEQVHEQFSLPIAEALLNAASQAKVQTSSAATVQQFLQELQASIRTLPVVTVILGFTPSNDLIRSISKWFDIYTGSKILIGVVIDTGIIGGVKIEWDGKYIDYSLKKLLQEKLKAKGDVRQ